MAGSEIGKIISDLEQGAVIPEEEARILQTAVLGGEVDTPDLLKIFEALDKRFLTEEELSGFLDASRNAMTKVPVEFDVLDTCGTGGDNSGSFNISTVAAIICAAAGIPVAKHGNRAASSLCGSADVLETLGVKIDFNPEEAARVLEKCGFVFLFARNYHPAFKYAAEARKLFGKKTYFNILGPLLSPASASHRVHGLTDSKYAPLLGKILVAAGAKKVWLLRADDLDEISPFGDTQVMEYGPEQSRHFSISPGNLALPSDRQGDIKGGDAVRNAAIINSILSGEGNPAQFAAAVLNAAAGLAVFGKVRTYEEGKEMAESLIRSGIAYAKLLEIAAVSVRESS